MPKENREKPEIKVTDKRIFTAEGDIREEFRNDIHPSDAAPRAAAAPATEEAAPKSIPPPTRPANKSTAGERREKNAGPPADTTDRRQTMADRAAASPGTAFSNFIEPLIAQAYISLGLMRNPYQPQATVDAGAARQMIDILSMLQEKTAGNLTDDESELLRTHLGQLKLAYVQVTKSLS